MEESKKKPIMIGVIVVCLAVAVIITYSRYSGGGGGIDSISEKEMIWVKCRNPSCEAEYQNSKKAYYKYIMDNPNPNPMIPTAPPLICKECGEPSVFEAVKCANPDCGVVFFSGISGPTDHADRCPKCGQSKIEESRRARLKERAAGRGG